MQVKDTQVKVKKIKRDGNCTRTLKVEGDRANHCAACTSACVFKLDKAHIVKGSNGGKKNRQNAKLLD